MGFARGCLCKVNTYTRSVDLGEVLRVPISFDVKRYLQSGGIEDACCKVFVKRMVSTAVRGFNR